MKSPRDPSGERLEQWVARVLGRQGPRGAPAALQDRVLAELERRAALPWWRRSYRSWPLGARATLLGLLAGSVKPAFLIAGWGASLAAASIERTRALAPFGTLAEFAHAAGVVRDAFGTLLQAAPTAWIYASLGAVAVLYVALFGLGAFAYRFLYRSAYLSGIQS